MTICTQPFLVFFFFLNKEITLVLAPEQWGLTGGWLQRTCPVLGQPFCLAIPLEPPLLILSAVTTGQTGDNLLGTLFPDDSFHLGDVHEQVLRMA